MSEPAPLYDQIGLGYAARRRSDSRWQERIDEALTGVCTLVNIGAGAGSYEPTNTEVIAVEPSRTMIAQRRAGAAQAVCAVAESLPFPDRSFDAAMAILTVHHWQDAVRGLQEMVRVADRQVVLTWDPDVFAQSFWLVRDYLPQVAVRERDLPTIDTVVRTLDPHTVVPLPVPADCSDGVLGAFWQRPEVYLDTHARAAMSGIALLDADLVDSAMQRLARDLRDESWMRRNAGLGSLAELDVGYCLVVAGKREYGNDH